jgi:hypothetical protein
MLAGERRPCAGRVVAKRHRRGYVSAACAAGHTWVGLHNHLWRSMKFFYHGPLYIQPSSFCCSLRSLEWQVWCPYCCDCPKLDDSLDCQGCTSPLHWFERDSFDTGRCLEIHEKSSKRMQGMARSSAQYVYGSFPCSTVFCRTKAYRA